MPLSQPLLWNLIKSWPLPSLPNGGIFGWKVSADTSFEDALMNDDDWTEESVNRLIGAYRQFLYLKALNIGAICPPEEIDRVWSLHLEAPQNYRALCTAIGRDLPRVTDLSTLAANSAYQQGIALYRAEFDHSPDRAIWPGRAQKIDSQLNLYISILFWCIALALLPFAWKASGSSAFVALIVIPGLLFGGQSFINRRWPRLPKLKRDAKACG